MGYMALVLSLAAVLLVAVPGIGKFLSLGIGIMACGLGFFGFRHGAASARLCSAGAIALGFVALLLGGAKIGLTVLALDRLERLFSP
ncbi:MAG: hypothetical protein HY698_09515 [Deltaproteobacteria bacterium]|nr:hypothetical protein [Deltaproteobacteria bacterium]